MDELHNNTEIEDIKKIADISIKNAIPNFMNHSGLYCIVIISIIMLIIILLPKSSSSQVASEPLTKDRQKRTLSENIESLRKLQSRTNKQPKVPLQTGKEKYTVHQEEHYLPPSIRTKSLPINNSPSKEMLVRMNSPLSFHVQEKKTSTMSSMDMKKEGNVKQIAGSDTDTRFLNATSSVQTVNATRLKDPFHLITAGELISATLITAINSELPGMIKAVINHDVYSLKGRRTLIPKGSIVVGQFNTKVIQGQNRLLVIWNRLMLPSGVIASLDSPGADSLGRSGIGADHINRHFLMRFSQSSLLSILGFYASNGGVSTQDQFNSISEYRQMLSSSLQTSSQDALSHDMQIGPTLNIHHGTNINIFVSKDINFTFKNIVNE